MDALVLLGTTTQPLTATPYTFQPDAGVADSNVQNNPQSWKVRVWSDVNFHVRTDGQPATTSDMPVTAGLKGVTVALPPGGSMSVVKQAGAADGTVWFTRVKFN